MPTIIASWVLVVLKTCESFGQHSADLLRDAGIDPNLIKSTETRIDISHYNRLWKVAVKRTADPYLGLKVIPFLKPTSFHALGVALIASQSIGEALDRLQKNYPLISDEVKLRIINKGGLTALCFSPNPNTSFPADTSVDAFMAVALTYARILDDEGFNPAYVEFMHPKPKNPEPFLQFFRAPVKFSTPDNRIYFHRQDIERPLPFANAEIALRNEQIARNYMSEYGESCLEDRVRRLIAKQLETSGPNAHAISRSLGMSIRSMNRHLKRNHTSYQMILDEIRKHLAIEYLKHQKLSIRDTAFKLGFADSSNFSRAFKRWLGVSPSQYLAFLHQ